MKTRDAFALRDFDGERILKRKFFSSCYLFHKPTDDDNLETFFVERIKNAPTECIKRALRELSQIKSYASEYTRRLLRHEARLERLMQKIRSDGEKYNRAYMLCQCYMAAISFSAKLQSKINSMIRKGKRILQKIFDVEFGERIIEARALAGLSRQELALILEVPLTTLANYERGTREPPPLIIVRLAEVLGRTPNQLLGFS